MQNTQNPFSVIQEQMNQARQAYDQTMGSLQSQLQTIRQQAASLYPNPYSPMQQYAQNMGQPIQQPIEQGKTQEILEHPQYTKQMEVLSGIKEQIEKTNELLYQFINGVPICKSEEKLSKTPKLKENESN